MQALADARDTLFRTTSDPPVGLGVVWIDQPEAAATDALAPVAATVVPPIAKNSAISEMTAAAEERCKDRRRMRDSLLTVAIAAASVPRAQ